MKRIPMATTPVTLPVITGLGVRTHPESKYRVPYQFEATLNNGVHVQVSIPPGGLPEDATHAQAVEVLKSAVAAIAGIVDAL